MYARGGGENMQSYEKNDYNVVNVGGSTRQQVTLSTSGWG